MISIYTANLACKGRIPAIVYVGITNNPDKRFRDHRYEARCKRKKTELGALLRQYPRSVHFQVIGECFDEVSAEECERGLIHFFRCHVPKVAVT
jgi:predicted GIY-YIG superfamily endonuclease